jgi:HEAT repeat protein
MAGWPAGDSLPLLVPMLGDSAAEVRKATIEALGTISDPPSPEQFIELLKGDNQNAREAAGAVLIGWRHPASTALLPPLLRHSRQEVRWIVARTLQSCGWAPEKEADRLALLVALGDFQGAAMIGAAALEPLTEALKDETRQDRRKIIQGLMMISDARVLKAFILALKDSDPAVRVLSIEALGDIREIQATEALVSALNDGDAHVRCVAVTALGKSGDVNAVPALIRSLEDTKWDVRKAAVEALGRLHDPRGVEPLTFLLKDSDHDVREAAAKSLGELRDLKAIEQLVVSLCDSQTAIRQAAAAALQRIDSHWDRSPAARRAIPLLKIALKDREYWVRQSAADVLQKISAMPIFEPRLGGISNPLNYRQQAALEALVVGLCDADRDLRLAAAEALGRIGDQRSIQALSRSLLDADNWVRDACARSLKLLGWNPDETERPKGDVWA